MTTNLKDIELKFASTAIYNQEKGIFEPSKKDEEEIVNLCYKIENKPFYFAMGIEDANYFNSFIKELYDTSKVMNEDGSKKKILFAVTANHTIPSLFLKHFEEFVTYNRKFFDIVIHVEVNYMIDEGRNHQILFAQSMQEKPDYIFFIDSDNTFKGDTLLKLVEADKDVISGLYFQRNKPHYPVAFKNNENNSACFFTEYKRGEIQEVDYVGAGCLLVKMEAINKTIYPQWYIYRNIEAKSTVGEDIVFCAILNNLGYKLYLHCGTQVGHIGGMNINETDWNNFYEKLEYIPNLQSNIIDFDNKIKNIKLDGGVIGD